MNKTTKTNRKRGGEYDASRPMSYWVSSLKGSKRRLLVSVLFYFIGWFVFYWFWRLHDFLRSFTSPEVENNSFWIVFVVVNIYLVIVARRFYRPETIGKFVAYALLLLLIATTVEYFYVIPVILGHCHPDSGHAEEMYRQIRFGTFSGIFIRDFIICSVLLLGTLYRDALAYNKIKKEKREADSRNACLQLRIGQYVEHAHFTNNALASMIGQLGELPEEKQKGLYLLLDIQRYSFAKSREDFVSLEEELSFARNLLDYYRFRYPDLEISCHVEGTVPSCSVPPLITEIPISNMFKHGITEAGEGRVRVDFILNDPSCFKMVCRNRIREDSVFFANPASMGISILRDRLDALYGKSASFHLEREGNEAVAVLTIPF